MVPHKDRSNTAAFLEEVIAYVLGLRKMVAEPEGVAENALQVPLVDIQAILNGAEVPCASKAAAMTTVGAQAQPERSGSADGASVEAPSGMLHESMAVAAPEGMGHTMMPHYCDAAMGAPDMLAPQHGMSAARGMPMPINSNNQVLSPARACICAVRCARLYLAYT